MPERAFLRKVLQASVISGAALASLLFLADPVMSGQIEYEVQVTGQRVNVRAEPTTKSEILFQVSRGDTLRLIEEAGDWYLVESPEFGEGYIYGNLVELIELPPKEEPLELEPAYDEMELPEEPLPTQEPYVAETWSPNESRSNRGLYKMIAGAGGVACGLLFMDDSKVAGVGLLGAGGYFLWDGWKERREGEGRRWALLFSVGRETRVAWRVSW